MKRILLLTTGGTIASRPGGEGLESGVIQGRDMTSEAAMTKLMWALGQGMSPEDIMELFARSLAGEISD